MGRWNSHDGSWTLKRINAPAFGKSGQSTDSDLETMERLQIGVGPRPKSPLLLRDQNKKAPLWDYLMN